MNKALDLSNQRFGRLTALRPVPGKRYHGFVVWECICDCGKKVRVASGMLRSGNTRSCGCLGNGRKHFDLEGQRFGRLIALRLLRRGNKIFWECICDCGKVTFVETGSLVSGNTKSCGCLPLEILDLTGQRFGRWSVVAFVEKIKSKTRWLCRCDCGNEAVVYGFSLRNGQSQSCGCLKRELTGARFRRTGLTDAEREQDRKYPAYYEWRDAVYERDDYTCRVCNVRGGRLRAHHLESFAAKRRLRIVMENGITLCAECHEAFHREYGKMTTRKQFDSWLYFKDLSERLEAGEFTCEQMGIAVVC